jgi:hypothetical protein
MKTIRETTDNGIIIEIPPQVGKYVYARTLGCVSNSVLLLVVEDRSSEQYAIKVVSREFLVSQGQFECFERELRFRNFVNTVTSLSLFGITALFVEVILLRF